jgi:hypothetical protein
MSLASSRSGPDGVKADRVRSVIRPIVRIGLWLGLLGGIAYALSRVLGSRPAPSRPSPDATTPWAPLPEPAPAWVEPTDGTCPTTHPVKAKLSSKIFHLPGMANYERTIPDRCYASAAEAEADGLRAAKR